MKESLENPIKETRDPREKNTPPTISRREFIKTTATAAAGAALFGCVNLEMSKLNKTLDQLNEIDEFKDLKEQENKKFEEVRKEFIKHIESEEYLNKLTVEFDGDQGKAQKEQNRRLKNVEKVKVDFLPYQLIQEIDPNAGAFLLTGPLTRKIFLPFGLSEENIKNATVHELSHASVRKKIFSKLNNIPKRTKNILQELYKNQDINDDFHVFYNEILEKEDKYFSNPDEMLARKKELDYDLERLGIKKYNEPTTPKHLEEALKRIFELSQGSRELLEKLDLRKKENFMKILDEIAKIDDISNKKELVA